MGTFEVECIFAQRYGYKSWEVREWNMMVEKIWPPKRVGTIRRCGLVVGSVSLWGWALRSFAQASHESVDFPLPLSQDAGLSAPVPCLPASCHAPVMATMD